MESRQARLKPKSPPDPNARHQNSTIARALLHIDGCPFVLTSSGRRPIAGSTKQRRSSTSLCRLIHVAAYLASLDISGFDPKAPSPKTPAFWDIVDANRAPEDAELADVLDRMGNPMLQL